MRAADEKLVDQNRIWFESGMELRVELIGPYRIYSGLEYVGNAAVRKSKIHGRPGLTKWF